MTDKCSAVQKHEHLMNN